MSPFAEERHSTPCILGMAAAPQACGTGPARKLAVIGASEPRRFYRHWAGAGFALSPNCSTWAVSRAQSGRFIGAFC